MKTRYAGITKRSGNRMPFVYRWSDYDGPHSKSFATLAEAREFQLGIERAKYDGSYTSPEKGKITFGEWAETWFERQTKRGELKPKTMAGYRDLLDRRVLPRWQRVPLGKIDFDPVDAWVAELSAELSPSRVRQCYFLLTGTLDAAVKAKLLTMNAARGVELPRLNDTEAKRHYLTAAQLEALAEACGERWWLLVMLLGYTGMRWGEMAALRAGRVVWNPETERFGILVIDSVVEVNGVQHHGVPKNHQQRMVGVPRFLTDAVRVHLADRDDDELMWPTGNGTPYRVNNFRRQAFDRAAAEIGIPGLTPHELRHTAASLAHHAGVPDKKIQKLLGHKQVSTTQNVYTHLFGDPLDEVADAMDEVRAKAQATPKPKPTTKANRHLRAL
jgi:integrase